MAGDEPMEFVEMRQLSRDGHLPMKNAPESVGYEIWPSCDVVLRSWTVTSVRTSVRVDLPQGYASVIHNKLGPCPRRNCHRTLHPQCKFSGTTAFGDAQHE